MWNWIKWGAVILVLVVIAAGYLFPLLTADRQDARIVCCAGNLKMIGLALKMYASDNGGFLPPDLFLLVANGYAENPKFYFCPKRKQKTPKAFSTRMTFRTEYCYAYSPGATWGGAHAATQIVALDCAGNHQNCGNVLFADGHVKGFGGYEWYRAAGFSHVPEPAR